MAIKVKANTTTAQDYIVGVGNSHHCIVKASTGRIWIAYVDTAGYSLGDILASYSDDGGSTWTEESVVADAKVIPQNNLGGLSLLIDSSDVPIIIYSYGSGGAGTSDAARYVDRSGGSWNAPEEIIAEKATQLVAAMDSADTIHLVYDNASSELRYVTGSTGSWSAGEDAVTLGAFDHPDLAINGSDEPVICYRNGSDIIIKVRTGGAWSANDAVYTLDGGTPYPMLCIDSAGDYHVTFQGDFPVTGTPTVFYIKKESGAWLAVQTIVDSSLDNLLSMITLDSSDNAYVIYQFESNTTQSQAVSYRKIITGTTLGDVTVLDSVILQPNGQSSLFSALYHRYPSSGILSPSVCPTVVLLLETGTDADVYYEARSPAGELAGLIAIVETRIHYFDAFGQERYIQGTAV